MLDSAGVMIDRGQTVVVSMTTHRQFVEHRDRIAKLAGDIGDDLEQEAMAVIAFDRADGFLVFPEDPDRVEGR